MYSVIDIETTGGSPARDKITEIAVISHDGTKATGKYSTLVNPERDIPAFITRITGISNEMVADAPKFYEIAREIVELTDNRIFVAHNVSFDFGFICEEFKQLGYNFNRERLCTVRLSRRVIPGHRSYSLGKICNVLGITIDDRHRAMGDALATARLFEMLMSHSNAVNHLPGNL